MDLQTLAATGLTVIIGLMAWMSLTVIKLSTLIAVLTNEISNHKADISLLFEKTRELERNEKNSIR